MERCTKTGGLFYLLVLSAAQPSMSKAPAGPVLTTSELVSGQQYVFTLAVAVQFREARAPVAAAARRMDCFIVGFGALSSAYWFETVVGGAGTLYVLVRVMGSGYIVIWHRGLWRTTESILL